MHHTDYLFFNFSYTNGIVEVYDQDPMYGKMYGKMYGSKLDVCKVVSVSNDASANKTSESAKLLYYIDFSLQNIPSNCMTSAIVRFVCVFFLQIQISFLFSISFSKLFHSILVRETLSIDKRKECEETTHTARTRSIPFADACRGSFALFVSASLLLEFGIQENICVFRAIYLTRYYYKKGYGGYFRLLVGLFCKFVSTVLFINFVPSDWIP